MMIVMVDNVYQNQKKAVATNVIVALVVLKMNANLVYKIRIVEMDHVIDKKIGNVKIKVFTVQELVLKIDVLIVPQMKIVELANVSQEKNQLVQ